MRVFKLAIFIAPFLFSNVVLAKGKISDSCFTAIHQHYIFLTLVEPILKTIPPDKRDLVKDRIQTIKDSLNKECPKEISLGISELTSNFDVAHTDFLMNLENDLKMDIPFVGEEIPLNRANMSDDEIKFWATLTLLKSYEITAKNFSGFSPLKQYYNSNALQAIADNIIAKYLRGYAKISDGDKNQIEIQDPHFQVHGFVASLPEIISQGIGTQERYTWRMKIPLLIESNKRDRIKKEKLTVYVTIIRMPSDLVSDGVMISEFDIKDE